MHYIFTQLWSHGVKPSASQVLQPALTLQDAKLSDGCNVLASGCPIAVPLLSHCCPTQNGKLTDRRLWPIRPTLLIPWCYCFVIAGTHGEAAQLFLAQVVAIRYPELLGSLNWSDAFKWRMEWIWMEQFKPRRLFLAATYDDGLTKIWSPSSDWCHGPTMFFFPMQWHFEVVNTINFMMTYWSQSDH